jgi:hypothetical protein
MSFDTSRDHGFDSVWDLGPKQDDPVSGILDGIVDELGGGRPNGWSTDADGSRATSRSPWADIIGDDSSSWKPASSWSVDTGGGGV